MSDWDEVRQLAADFRRVQESTGAHKLSERNCIELVTRLIATGQVQVVYTLDGKEYVTPQQLEREIRGELIAHRGRINVIELQAIMNVDLSHVENKVNEMLKHDRSISLLQGELISQSYIDGLCEEINDSLQENGQRSVADISKSFSLPNSFLLQILENAMGDKIEGELDKSTSGVIYTEAYVRRYRSRVRGLFSAITSPTSIGPLIAQGEFQEKLFLSVLHKLINSGQLHGSLRGHGDKALYVPEVYIRMQNKWTDAFLSSNGYLEYDALRRLGIDDPKGYVARRYCATSGVEQLESCAVGEMVLKELEGAVEDIHTSEMKWIDVVPLLPAPCTAEDARLLLHKKYDSDTNLKLFGNYVTTSTFMESCCDLFKSDVKEKAVQAASQHAMLLSEMVRKESDVPSVKTSRGRSGRDKKSKRSGGKYQSEEFPSSVCFMSIDEVAKKLCEDLIEDEELSEHIARSIEGVLQAAFLKEAIANLLVDSAGPGQASGGQSRKRHANLQEKIQGLWNTANLFNKAIDSFEGEAAIQLSKYLLKTLCSDLTNIIVGYLAEDLGLVSKIHDELSPKVRSEYISKFPEHIKKAVSSVDISLSGKDVDVFLSSYQQLCGENYCGFMLKKVDKKKERQLLFSHQQSLRKSLLEEKYPAMALHLILVLLFQQETGSIIHVPGKFIPTMISFLRQHLPRKEHGKLVKCQDLITSKWKAGQVSESEGEQSGQESGIRATPASDMFSEEDTLGATPASDMSSEEDTLEALLEDLKCLVIRVNA